MPLLDHFHAPVSPRHSWEGFHARWTVSLSDQLNRVLPPGRFLAEPRVHLGKYFEVDGAEFELDSAPALFAGNGAHNGGIAVQAEVYAPPAPLLTVATVFPDEYEVGVFDLDRDRNLVGAIELVSPANKDRPDTRRAFAAKCSAYLQHGIGLIVIDIVTEGSGNLHRELLEMLGQGDAAANAGEKDLYAVAYRPARRDGSNLLDVWPHALTVGSVLPPLPLALRGTVVVPVDLEAADSEARQRIRL